MESLLIIILVIIVIICAMIIFYATIYNKFQDYVIRINEVESIIDNCLRSKYDLINRAIPIVKSNIDKDEAMAAQSGYTASDVNRIKLQKELKQ